MHSPAVALRSPATASRLPGTIDRLAGRLTNRLIRATPWRLIPIPTRQPIVSFTFDDVPDSALRAGATILEARDVRGTFYIAGGLEGRVEPGRTLIDAAGCRELAARGHEIGCHTYEHVSTLTLSPAELDASLARNAAWVAERLDGYEMRTFASPSATAPWGPRR